MGIGACTGILCCGGRSGGGGLGGVVYRDCGREPDSYSCVCTTNPIPGRESNYRRSYHYPAVTNGLVISASAFRRLSKHPNIVGAKFSHGDVSLHTRVALDPEIDHAGFAVFTGLGQQLVSVLQLGCAGGIDGLAAVFPATLVRLYQLGLSTAELLHGAEVDEMRKLQYRVAVMEELVVKCGVRGIKEAAARVMGWEGSGRVRAPLARMGKAEWEEWEGLVEETRIADAKIFVEMVKRGE